MARPRAGKPLLTGTERPWRTGRSRVSGHHPLSGQKSKLHYCCFDHRFAKPLRNIAHVFWHRHRADLGWSTHGRWSRRSGLSPYPRSRRPVLFVGGNEYCRNMRILLRTSSRFSWADRVARSGGGDDCPDILCTKETLRCQVQGQGSSPEPAVDTGPEPEWTRACERWVPIISRAPNPDLFPGQPYSISVLESEI